MDCSNGYIDREEFGRLAESTAGGMEYAMFHWLDDDTVDKLFAKYAKDSDIVTAINFDSFRRLVRFRLSYLDCWLVQNAVASLYVEL